MYFARSSFWNSVPIARVTSSPFQASVTFCRGWIGGHRLERRAPDEVVVELHERPVAEVVRREVVVGDVVGVVAPAERAGALVALRGQPLAVRLHVVAGEDRRQRARDPARLERVRRVDARADVDEAELGAGLEDRGLDLGAVVPRAEDLAARDARHAVVQRAHLAAGDRDPVHVEEPDLGQRPAVELLEHLERVRALDLVAVDLAVVRVDGRALVALAGRVVAAGLAVVLHPVVRRRAGRRG